ncbi:hypothetical protein chiPu_0022177, partial [Chiloscyllium punctatum]|nr:hypothetical protein [Chiloscyllium punctatum]
EGRFVCEQIIKAKPGSCPQKSVGVRLCGEMCIVDSDCPGNQKCCGNGCGHSCVTPKKGTVQQRDTQRISLY